MKPKKVQLTQEKLMQFVTYEPDTGVFRWKVGVNYSIKPGDRAGYFRAKDGYRLLMVDGERLLEHRLAWLYVHGEHPIGYLDHINGKRDDNRIENLRPASKIENGWNRARNSNNASGQTGVYEIKAGRKKNLIRYVATVNVGGRRVTLGRYETKAEAIAAYRAAAKLIHGQFYTDRGSG
jgi:hypothetical protein